MSTEKLEVRGLTTGHIANIPVLHQIDLDLVSGQVLGVMGRNGAGKSTLAAALVGVLRTWSGSVRMLDWDCTRAASTLRVRRGLVAVPENRRLFGQLTVLENLRVAAFGSHQEFTPAIREAIEAEFPIVARKGRAKASALSGGEQQMVALARARVMKPRFLLLDEPSLGLAPAIVSELAEVIGRFASSGVGVMLIEQNLGLIEKVCSTVRLLDEGRFVRDIPITELGGREAVLAAYLGAPGAASDVPAPPLPSPVDSRGHA